MTSRRLDGLLFLIVATVLALNCSKSSSPTQPPPTSQTPQLTATPPSAIVGAGATTSVVVSGGNPPYAISSPPSSIATAFLLNPDSLIATIQITGVTVASVSTAVMVRDNTASAPKTVTVPITVQ